MKISHAIFAIVLTSLFFSVSNCTNKYKTTPNILGGTQRNDSVSPSGDFNKNNWLNFVDLPNDVISLADGGDYLWAATYTGLVKYNKSSGEKYVYDRLILGFPFERIRLVLSYRNKTLWAIFGYGYMDYDSVKNKNLPVVGKFDGSAWEYYNANDVPGKIEYDVRAALDSSGRLWTTCDKGLLRFEGGTVTGYTAENSNLPEDLVYEIRSDPKGIIWTRVGKGLAKFDGKSFKLFEYNNPFFEKTYVNGFTFDKKGDVYMCISLGDDEVFFGIARWDFEKYTLYTSKGKSSFENFTGYNLMQGAAGNIFAFDSMGNLWIGNGGNPQVSAILDGLFKFDGKRITRVNSHSITSMVFDSDNILWIGNETFSVTGGYIIREGMLTKYDGKEFREIKLGDSPTQYHSLVKDRKDNFWFNTFNGLVQFKQGKWIYLSDSSGGCRSNERPEMAVDSNGIVYFSVSDYGLCKFNGKKWGSIPVPEGCDLASIRFDKSNELYLKGFDEIAKYNNGRWIVYNKNNTPILGWWIGAMNFDLKNNMVVLVSEQIPYLSDSYKLVVKTGEKWETIGDIEWSSFYADIFVDSHNRYWLGPEKGILMFDGSGIKPVYEVKQGDHFELNSIYEDNIGRLMLCTFAGLMEYKDGKLINLGETYPVLSHNVECARIDKAGVFWIGTFGEGLVRLDFSNGEIRNYNIYNSGLLDNYVYRIEIDGYGNKWLHDGSGISVFNENGITQQ